MNKIIDGIGWGCGAALVSSAIALTGSWTLLGMSWLIPNNHMPDAVEDAARRLAATSVLVGSISALGLVTAVAKSEEERLHELMQEKMKIIYSQASEINRLKWCHKIEFQSAVEVRDNEIKNRGITIRELRIKLSEGQQPEIQQLQSQLVHKQQQIDDWLDWWSSVRNAEPEYEIAGCRGCKHYEGSNYQGNFFVCAMYPYGQKGCEDWDGQL